MKKRITITVSGRVQGIFFRNNAKKLADQLGIVGYARNLSDGRVCITGEGSETSLRKLLDWCYRGSYLAKVDGLSFQWEKRDGKYKTFTIDTQGKTFVEDKALALYNLSKRILGQSPAFLPKHIAIIPDGNRRWAQERNLPVWRGHQKAIDQTLNLFKEMRRLGIQYCTLWGFSTENWSRKKSEVSRLMAIFQNMITKLRNEAFAHEVAVHHFGRKDRLPKKLVAALTKLEQDTRHFSKYHVGIALDYGGRDELLRAIKKLNGDHASPSEVHVSEALDTNGFPDPDLIIRTGGEQRLSGLMPWQSVYSELYFSPLHFPDFTPLELRYAIEDYSSRHRNFGA